MIVGDHLLPKITPHVGLYPDATGDPLGDFINSQLKVQKFDVEHVLAGAWQCLLGPSSSGQSAHRASSVSRG